MPKEFIAHYRVTGKLGAGGMGEVYRATDTKLEREVAIKILPSGIRNDRPRMARFEREAKALASLNHPHIAGIYGVEDFDQGTVLILELLEGESLATRLSRDPVSIDEALEISQQIAEALQAAHEQGIIHRDLKPANIHFTRDGKIKVLDFGLAKSLDEASASDAMETGLEDSPTITADATRPGSVIGTAGYMSPEQARGQKVDQRTDVWAFGCCLYEMLTGGRPFRGETVTDRIAEVLKTDPDWTSIPGETPESVRTLLRRCLEKDHRRRLSSAGDIAILLQEVATTSRTSVTSASREPHKPSVEREERAPASAHGESWWWKLAAFGGIGAAIFLAVTMIQKNTEKATSSRSSVDSIRSLAILPFDDLKPDEEFGWLSDAMADAIRDKLSTLDGIIVRRGHTPLKAFTANGQSVSDAAKVLKVDALVQGNFVHHQGELRINVSLYQGNDGRDITLGLFDGEAGNVFELQSDVSLAIAERLRTNLDEEEKARLAESQEIDPNAYEANRKGLQAFDLFTTDGFDQAEDYFGEAIRIDPGYGEALHWLSSIPWVRTIWGGTPLTPEQGISQAKAILDRYASEVRRPADLLGAQAWLAMYGDRQWSLADQHSRRALSEANKDLAVLNVRTKYLALVEGRYLEALEVADASLELEPDRLLHLDSKGDCLAWGGSYQRAIDQFQDL